MLHPSYSFARKHHCPALFGLLEYRHHPFFKELLMKDVVFFTPNRGTESAAEFIFTALNTGGPQRFSKIDFRLIDKDKTKCAAVYNTTYKSGNENLLSVETLRINGEEGPRFFLMIVLRFQSIHGSILSRRMFPITKKQPRFPNLTDAWHTLVRKQLGHMTNQDLWNNLLNMRKLSRMPL